MPRPAFTVHDRRAIILGALALLCLVASTRLPAEEPQDATTSEAMRASR